jgi:MSHA pilin protein MshC
VKSDFCSQPDAGFTIIELVTVLIVVGIVGAIGVGRFFDNRVFENRAYADQAKAIFAMRRN